MGTEIKVEVGATIEIRGMDYTIVDVDQNAVGSFCVALNPEDRTDECFWTTLEALNVKPEADR